MAPPNRQLCQVKGEPKAAASDPLPQSQKEDWSAVTGLARWVASFFFLIARAHARDQLDSHGADGGVAGLKGTEASY